jgi:hypothetical protein
MYSNKPVYTKRCQFQKKQRDTLVKILANEGKMKYPLYTHTKSCILDLIKRSPHWISTKQAKKSKIFNLEGIEKDWNLISILAFLPSFKNKCCWWWLLIPWRRWQLVGLSRTSVAFDLGLFCVSDREKERLGMW